MNFKCVMIVFIILCLFSEIKKVGAEENIKHIIKLGYKILETSSIDENVNILAKLKVKNTSSKPIHGVKAIVLSTNNITIDINEIYLGNINPKETKESTETFNLSFKRSASQDSPQREIVWQIKYSDANGNLFVEEVILR